MDAVTDEINMKYSECYTLQCIALHGIPHAVRRAGTSEQTIRFSDFVCFFFARGDYV
jgi:hypothetical protein